MGAQGSAQRDGKSREDAPASAELSAEVPALQEKNGQISSMTSLNGPSEDSTMAEVGQPDGGTVAPKEEAPENMDTLPDEVTPQLNGEKLDKESPEANSLSSVEVKSTEEKGEDPGEVGFKKIFTIVGLKFTVKKDKSEETDPVKLLTVKDKDGEEVSETDEPTKEKETETEEEDSKTETMETEKETSTSKEPEKAETPDGTSAEASIEGAKAEGAKTEGAKTEEVEKESETPPTPKETISPFRKLFFVGLFSNLRKKSSLRRMKEEEEAAKANETAEAKEENDVKEEKTKEENAESEQEVKSEASATPVEEQLEPKEEATTPPKEEKSDTAAEAPAETSSPTDTTDESKPEDQKAEAAAKDEAAPAEVTSEAELQSSQEKTKIHGSPLKKLFTGSGLKKLSTKRQKSKKDTGEQLQSSTESEEGPKAESGPSSPESPATGEPVTEGNQNESSQETEGEVASDGEKKKDSVIASFRKLVTPKKHAKRLSDSDDEATSDKPAKSATLSSSESAPLAEKGDEEETKEEKVPEEEPKTDNSEKLTTSTEEAKKKMDTSVSWEALMCMGGPKKRTRKTSDSDDDETKAEEEAPAAAEAAEEEGGQEEKIEPAAVTPQETESEAAAAPAPEPVSAPPVRESPWATLKRLVASKNKPKVEVKPESSAELVQPEAEAPKEESSFSLKKLFPGRKKKVVEKPPSPEQEEDSETPAVVPLSEYDDQTPAEQVSPEETAEVQNKVSAEDRTPSWIPASVEDADDRRDQLSDITEEAENAATPKSIDTDNTEDDTDDIVPPPNRGNMGRRLSTAEVKPITPAPDASTSPVPKSPETESAVETLGRIKPQISEVPFQTCVTVEDPPVNVATVAIEQEPETDIIESTTKTFLEAHKRSDATAICIGLETKESVDPPVEEPVEPTVESAPALKSAQTTELAVQEKSDAVEEASVSEDAVFNAHVHQVQILELERVAEDLAIQGAEIQAARESFESEIEKIGVVSIENSEVIQPVTLKENSPKAVAVDPISPTLESTPCSQSAEVSEVTVESKEKHVSTEKLSATGENTPVRAMLQVVAGEATPNNRKGGETAITAIVPSEESAVMMDTVVLVAPEEKATSSVSKASMSDTFVSAKKMSRKVKEEVHRDKEIENRSAEIAQTVIQDAVDKVSEDGPTGNNADKPGSLIPTPVKAIATTEKEVEVATEPVVITDTPSPVLCKKTVKKAPVQLCVATEVTESIPIEVIETLEGEKGVGKEKKLEKRLKTAEIKVSEETVVEEEVGEIGGKREKSKKGDGGKTQPEEKKAIHMPIQVVLQEAEEVEEPPVEVEVTSELNGESSPSAKNPPRIKKLSSLSEEPQVPGSEEAAGCNQDTETTGSKSSVKCAEVMAQVIEVIEEAVKEIEPMSTELTAAS
ncbi:A-kinase anchor protein 12b isoform X1 [Oryzias melastigma]|uniref:A-kinase anchor protein 12b isoform X1 n=1 Tax=Oryzias melastigma TaxID=30732 RepID=UPI000CF804FB|nr:A-kinase anchor protein 12b isoform X1 [Oryzias melastigma]